MSDELLEISVIVDSEAAEAVSELFNRYNGGGYEEDNDAGEAGGGGAVVEATGFDDVDDYAVADAFAQAAALSVKTYIKPGVRGNDIRRQIEEGLWRLSLIYPIPEPQIRTVKAEDWAHAWKQFYKPMRVGKRVILKPSWEEFAGEPDDVIIQLDPGMAFGTGLHPSTRLCLAGLEEILQPGDSVLDVGTGSGVLAVAARRLGAGPILATDIDSLAVQVAAENAALNNINVTAGEFPLRDADEDTFVVRQGSVPAGTAGQFDIIAANILAEILVKLLDGAYDNVPLAEPLKPGGTIVLAGILAERADLVIHALQRHGLQLTGRKEEGDWVALMATRPQATVD